MQKQVCLSSERMRLPRFLGADGDRPLTPVVVLGPQVTDHATTALLHYQLPQMPDVVVRSFMVSGCASDGSRRPVTPLGGAPRWGSPSRCGGPPSKRQAGV